MTTKADVTLSITADDAGTATLEQLQKILDDLRKSQEEYAKANDVTARTTRELARELDDLRRVQQALENRQALLDSLDKQNQALAEAESRVRETAAALAEYRKQLEGVENKSPKQRAELNKLERAYASADKQLKRSAASLADISSKLEKLGISDGSKARQEIARLGADTEKSLRQARLAIRAYDAALREKRASEKNSILSSRALTDAQKRLAASNRELSTRRQVVELARGALALVSAARQVREAAAAVEPAGESVARALRQIADPAREAARQLDTLEKALADLEADLKAASAGDANAAENIRRQRSEYAAFARDATKAALAVADTIDTYKRQSAALDETRAALDAARQRVAAYAAEVLKVGVPTEELRRKLAAAKAELAALTAQFQRDSQGVAQLGARLRDAGVDTSRLVEAQQRLVGVTTRLANAQRTLGTGTVRLGQANRQVSSSFLDVADKGRKALSIYQRIRGQVLALASAYIGLFGAFRFAQASINAVGEREGTLIRLQVAAGNDARKAAQDFAFLRREADRLGLALEPLAAQYSRFAIAASAANLTNEEVKETFLGFAEASRVFNLSVEDTQGVFRALEQVLSKGKVQAEELRGQLGDRLSGAFTAFARALGLSNEELDKLLETGQVTAREIVKLGTEYRKTVGGQLEPATKTLRAELARLQTAIVEFQLLVAQGGLADAVRELAVSFRVFLQSEEGARAARDIATAFRAFGDAVLFTLRNFDALRAAVVQLFGVLAARFILNLIADFSRFSVAIRATAAAMGTATIASRGLAIAMRAIPIVFLATAIAGLVNVFLALRDATTSEERAMLALREAVLRFREAAEDSQQAARDDLELKRDAAKAALDAAKATLSQARAQLELNEALKTQAALGDATVQFGLAVGREVQRRRVEAAEKRVKELERDLALADLALNPSSGPQRRFANNRPRNIRLRQESEEELAAAKKLADERAKLEQQAIDAILDARKEALQAEKDNIEAQLTLIDIEFGERLLRVRNLQEQLRAVGAESTAADLDALVDTFFALRNISREEVQRNSLLESRKALQDELKAKEEALNRAIESRNAQLDLINTKRELGLLTERQAREESTRAQVESQDVILGKIRELRDFILNNEADLSEFLNIEGTLTELERLEVETANIASQTAAKVREIEEAIAGGAADALVAFGEGIANVARGVGSLGDAFKGARNAFLEFAADFLTQIARMIVQAQILRLLQNIPGLGGVLGSVAGLSVHAGGVIGYGGGSPRRISAALLAAAPRYHSGAMVGLRSDERPAILQTGEEVLSRRDPRNALNGGGASAQQIKIVNAIDGESLLKEMLSSPSAVKTIANMIQSNKAAFKTVLT